MMIKKSVVLFTSLICVSVLTSCSRGTVTTVDKSVDYQSAQSLPSLTKERPASSVDSDTTQSVEVSEKIKNPWLM